MQRVGAVQPHSVLSAQKGQRPFPGAVLLSAVGPHIGLVAHARCQPSQHGCIVVHMHLVHLRSVRVEPTCAIRHIPSPSQVVVGPTKGGLTGRNTDYLNRTGWHTGGYRPHRHIIQKQIIVPVARHTERHPLARPCIPAVVYRIAVIAIIPHVETSHNQLNRIDWHKQRVLHHSRLHHHCTAHHRGIETKLQRIDIEHRRQCDNLGRGQA